MEVIVTADGYLNFNTKIDTSGFETGLKNITGRLENLKSGLLKIAAAVGAAFSVTKITEFAKNAIESAAEINAANSQLEQTFGEMQSAAEDAIAGVAESSGIIKTRLNGVATSIYAFAKTSGMDSATALNMMTEALTVAADSAAYYDRSLEETSETLKSFLKGNFANDAALGISCTETTRNTAANKLYSKSFSELSESQKQLVLLQMVKDANELSGAMGQAARESEGWENVLGNLKEQWKQLLAVIGQPILQAAISAVKKMTSALEILTEKAHSAVGAIMGIFGIENTETAEISENIAESTTNQNELTEAVEETEKAQKNSLATFDKINTISSGNDNKNDDISADSPHTPLISPVVDESHVDDAVDELAKRFRRLLMPIKVAWEDNSPEFIQNAKYAVDSVKSLFSSVGNSIAEVWTNGTGEKYVGNIIVLFGDVLGIIGDVSTALKNAWDDDGRGEKLVQSYFNRWNALLELIHVVSEDFREVWNNGTGESILGNILEIQTNINNTVTNLRENFKKAWSENEVGQRIIQGVLDIFKVISETVNDITFSTSEWAKNVDFSPFLESVDSLLQSLEPLTENIGSGLEDFYNDVLLPLASWAIEEALPASIDVFSGAIDLLNSVLEVFKPLGKWLWDKFLKPISEWSGEIITSGLENLADTLKNIAVWVSENKTASAIILGLSGTVLALNAAINARAISTFIGGLSALIKALWTINVTVGVIIAGITGWVYAITEIYKNWSDILSVIESDGGIFNFIGNWIDSCREEIENFFSSSWLGEKWYEFWSGVGELLYNCGGNLILGLFEGIADMLSGVAVWLKENVTDPIINGFKSLFGIHSPSTVMAEMGGYIIDGFCNGISDSITKVKEIFEKVLNKIETVFENVDEWFKEKFQTAKDNITAIFENVGTWFSDRWNDVKSAFSEVGDWFKEQFETALNNVTSIFEDIGAWFGERWEDVKSSLSEVDDWFKEQFETALNNVTSIFKGIGTWFEKRWSDVKSELSEVGNWFKSKFQTAWDNVTSVFSKFSDWFGKKWDKVKSVYSETGDFFKKKFQSAWNNITEIFANPAEFFDNVWTAIKGCFSHVSDWFHDTFSEAWEKVKNVFSSGGEIFDGITNGIFETFKSVVNHLIDGINSVIAEPFNAINWALDGIRGIGFGDIMPFEWLPSISIPEIPKLAQGTVVPANYGEFLAVLGDNKRETEIVSPLSTIEKAVQNAMQKSGGNFPKEIIVNTYLYPNSTYFHREIIKIVDDDKQRRGG